MYIITNSDFFRIQIIIAVISPQRNFFRFLLAQYLHHFSANSPPQIPRGSRIHGLFFPQPESIFSPLLLQKQFRRGRWRRSDFEKIFARPWTFLCVFTRQIPRGNLRIFHGNDVCRARGRDRRERASRSKYPVPCSPLRLFSPSDGDSFQLCVQVRTNEKLLLSRGVSRTRNGASFALSRYERNSLRKFRERAFIHTEDSRFWSISFVYFFED